MHVEPTLWEFTLQPDVSFWSGAPVDAEAVVASLQRHRELNKRATSVLGELEFIVVDADTFQLRTPAPDPGLAFRPKS